MKNDSQKFKNIFKIFNKIKKNNNNIKILFFNEKKINRLR